MIYDELKTGLKIYNSLSKQDRFIKNKDSVYSFDLVSPKDAILPFQIRLLSAASVSSYKVKDIDGNTIATLGTSTLSYTSLGSYNYVINKGQSSGINLGAGKYYVEIVISGSYYYSEVFTVPCISFSVNDVSIPYTKIEWDNDGCNLGPIIYTTGYKNTLYFDATINKEEPTIEEEGYEDGNKLFYPTLVTLVDTLHFEAGLIPYTIADSLAILAMHKRVVVTLPNSIYTGQVKNIKPTMALQDGTSYYLFSLKFQQPTEYVNACCGNLGSSGGGGSQTCSAIISTPTATANGNGAVVSWSLTTGNAYNYVVSNGVESYNVTGTSYTFTSLPVGSTTITVTPYCLINGNYVAGQSKSVLFTRIMQLSSPTISTTVISSSQINLSWNTIANASYIVERALNNTFTSGLTTVYSGTNTAYNNTSLSASTTYFYRIKAISTNSNYTDSNWSNIAQATTSTSITVTAPTLVGDDTNNTLGATAPQGTIYYRENNGSWLTYSSLINVGNVARAAGYWQFKATYNGVDSSIVNSPAFTTNLPLPIVSYDSNKRTLSATTTTGNVVVSTDGGSTWVDYLGPIYIGINSVSANVYLFASKSGSMYSGSIGNSAISALSGTSPYVAVPTVTYNSTNNTIKADDNTGSYTPEMYYRIASGIWWTYTSGNNLGIGANNASDYEFISTYYSWPSAVGKI